MNQLDRIVAASLALKKHFPYFCVGINSLKIVEDAVNDTLSVSGNWILRYNPTFVSKLNTDQLIGIYFHEFLHLLRSHHRRFKNMLEQNKNMIFDLWNVACDIEVNQEVTKFGFKLPTEVVNYKLFKLPENLTAEEYYNLLLTKTVTQYMKSICSDINMDVDPTSSENASVHDFITGRIQKEMDSCIAGKKKGERSMKIETFPIVISWTKIIRMRISQIRQCNFGFKNYTWSKLHRKSASNLGVIYPKWFSTRPGRLYVAIDTSRSMINSINLVFSHLRKILAEFKEFKITLIECDYEIQAVHNDLKRIPEKTTGLGGTNLCHVFNYLETLRDFPDCLLILTDGYTPWPGPEIVSKYKSITTVGIVNSKEESPFFNVMIKN